jgi:hypothetical protein
MQYDTPWIKGWERLNLMRNVVKKTSIVLDGKKRMTRWANDQTPTPNLAHNLKRTQCKSKGK